MITLQVGKFRALIDAACEHTGNTPQYPQLSQSGDVLVPTLEYFKKQFFPAWQKWVEDHPEVKNYRPKGKRSGYFCELVAKAAALVGLVCMGKTVEITGEDAQVAIHEARITVVQAPFMGLQEPGGHFTILIAFHHEGSEEIQFAIWEPQDITRFNYEKIEKVLDYCDLLDVSV